MNWKLHEKCEASIFSVSIFHLIIFIFKECKFYFCCTLKLFCDQNMFRELAGHLSHDSVYVLTVGMYASIIPLSLLL